MALSQIQCLGEQHVNWRCSESKPEFFYSEDQRLALEALLRDGEDAFRQVCLTHGVRTFLSALELQRLCGSARPYAPARDTAGQLEGAGGQLGGAGEQLGGTGTHTPSLQYWPERSDVSLPQLELGWPDGTSYRGVTRANVYAQPPLDGQSHIKEVVRKSVAQAQKVIAVVMDLFTDVDIFKDLLDAGFKRKVAVYIVLDEDGVAHFLDMCNRAAMHRGHLKNLRVRKTSGTEFYTHYAKKVTGSMSQKFMFVDGDRAISGSYSYTWSASRLDRNLVTVLTGQAVDTFDKVFQELYLNSHAVDLSVLSLDAEPEPEPLPQAAPAPLPSAAVARKLINPKYALVSNGGGEPGSRTSSGKNSAKNDGLQVPPPPQRHTAPPPPCHPGLLNMERANMIAYLPTWPEPDPPSDVIGFINIRNSSKQPQAHLMRSELFETSQAVRFKEPFVAPQEPLPDKVYPREHWERAQPLCPVAQQEEEPRQPGDQEATPVGRPARDTPPVPKPRTVQVLINHDHSRDTVNISMVRKCDHEGAVPHIRVSEPAPDPEQTVERLEEEAEEVHERGVRIIEGTNEPDANRTNSLDSQGSVGGGLSDGPDAALELTVNGMQTGSGRADDHRHADALNLMARFSQSMLDLRPENQQLLEREEADGMRALADIRKALEGERQQWHGNSERKLCVTSSRSPANVLSSERDRQGRTLAKVVIAKPGTYHRPCHVIGGHKYWQAKLFGQDKPPSGRSSPNRLAATQPGPARSGRSPGRHGDQTRPLAPPPEDTRTPCGISFAKLAHFRNLKGKISSSALASLQKKAALGHKGAI